MLSMNELLDLDPVDDLSDLLGSPHDADQTGIEGGTTPPPPGGEAQAVGGGGARGLPGMSGTEIPEPQVIPCISTTLQTTLDSSNASTPNSSQDAPGSTIVTTDDLTPASMTANELRAFIGGLDLDKLTYVQKKGFLEILEAKTRYEAENMLASYIPYPKQMEFHAAGSTWRERLLMAGNQLGKCATVASYIEHPDGSRSTFGEVYENKKPIPVMSWDGQRVVEALAIGPIRKPAEPCVRLWFTDGSWFECALNHRVLGDDGAYLFVHQLIEGYPPASAQDLRGSTQGCGQSARGEDARRSSQTLPGFLGGCLAGLRSCDARLHQAQGSVRAWLRRRADALQRSSASCGSGECSTTQTNIAQSEPGPLSSLGVLARYGVRIVGFLDRGVCWCARRTTVSIRAVQRLLLATYRQPQLTGGVFRGQSLKGALVSPNGKGNQLVAHEVIPVQPVYDISVPAHGNYVANGIVHHNTFSAAAETAYHLTGLYPDWWQGKVFTRPTRGLAAGVTSQLVRDSMQVLLFGAPAKALGEGMVPKRCIAGEPVMARSISGAFDTVRVTHVSGGESVLYLRAYEQGREKVQAMTLDFFWLDEEPPEDYYTEGLTRTNVTEGPVYMTFTPLKGITGTVGRFLLEKQGHVTIMTIDDALHYTPEQRERIIAQYPAHERDARTRGVPALGSGRIFPIEEERITVQAFPLPKHWPKLCAIDFGWNHPAGVAWAAWDRDTDIVYIYDCYRAKETLIPNHAVAIKARGAWIPVSWPHDGYQVKDAMHGEQLAAQYRTQGVNMRMEHAAFAESPVLAERKLSRISTEAGIQEMLTRMDDGRLKVFSHLADWFEEYRMYHRKDGLIVKKRDDIMSASRLLIMDLRHAEAEPNGSKMINHERRSDGYL